MQALLVRHWQVAMALTRLLLNPTKDIRHGFQLIICSDFFLLRKCLDWLEGIPRAVKDMFLRGNVGETVYDYTCSVGVAMMCSVPSALRH